jgi:hypothetical protein
MPLAWRRLLLYLPPVLLVAVAGTQITLSQTRLLVPWKGGGFGMFSSVDREGNRIIRAFLIADGREQPVGLDTIDDDLARPIAQARACPTSARLTPLIPPWRRQSRSVGGSTAVAAPRRGSASAGAPSGRRRSGMGRSTALYQSGGPVTPG